jgi:hypothetical protein
MNTPNHYSINPHTGQIASTGAQMPESARTKSIELYSPQNPREALFNLSLVTDLGDTKTRVSILQGETDDGFGGELILTREELELVYLKALRLIDNWEMSF